MKAENLFTVKRKCQNEGYSGFAVFKGYCYMKAGGPPLTKQDLEFAGEDSPVTFHLYNPEEVQEEPLPHQDYFFRQAEDPAQQHNPHQQQYQHEPTSLPGATSQESKRPAPEDVDILVRHALPEKESEVTVRVP